jgi:RNA polymerase primary sigma factor
MDDVLINVVDEDEEYPAIARLIELGRQKSYVTIDDILHFFPDAEQDVEQLEEAFAALISAGIPYVEDEAIEEPSGRRRYGIRAVAAEDESAAKELSWMTWPISIPMIRSVCTLKEVSRVPLLTAEEEVELAQRIERGRMAREELARGNVKSAPPP